MLNPPICILKKLLLEVIFDLLELENLTLCCYKRLAPCDYCKIDATDSSLLLLHGKANLVFDGLFLDYYGSSTTQFMRIEPPKNFMRPLIMFSLTQKAENNEG